MTGVWSSARALETRALEIREHFGAKEVALVSSGTAALTLTLLALRDLSPKTDVVIPAFTCYSVPAAVLKAGLRPVPCDIDPATFGLDEAQLERVLTSGTLCVVLHHLFAIPANVERVVALCRARGIFVVEDAAQAMGIRSNGAYLGTRGDAGIFSLGRGKNVTTGSGGVIVTSDDRLGVAIERQVRQLRPPSRVAVFTEFVKLVLMTVFIRPGFFWIPSALPFLRLGETIFPDDVPVHRLSGLQAGVLHGWRERLDRANRVRAENAADIGRRLSLTPKLGQAHPYLRLPVFAASAHDKARILAASRRQGLGLSPAYPAPIHRTPQLRDRFAAERFPSADRVAEHLLTIPTHHFVRERDKRAIVECLSGGTRTASSLAAAHHG